MRVRIFFSAYLILIFLKPAFSLANPDKSLSVDPQLGTSVMQCAHPASSARHVWIFKQWHLAPSINTHANAAAGEHYAQAKNQAAIFNQLDPWIAGRQIKEIYAEGCSGLINGQSNIQFNGWKIDDLKPVSKSAGYPEILTSVPLKLEAKYGDSLRTVCGDDEALVKENGLAFSDARGAIGFLTRLMQYKEDPSRQKTYLDGAIQSYKMDPTTNSDQAIERAKIELKDAVERAKAAMEKRNRRLVEIIQRSTERDVAVVFGGMHAVGIVQLLNDAGLRCTVIEPAGYQDDDENLLRTLDRAIKNL